MIKETIIVTAITICLTAAIGSLFVKTVFEMLEMLISPQDKHSDHSGPSRKTSS